MTKTAPGMRAHSNSDYEHLFYAFIRKNGTKPYLKFLEDPQDLDFIL